MERLAIGQLLLQTYRAFEDELFARIHEHGFDDVRVAHSSVMANLDAEGTRLTELASRAGMTRPSMAELVDDLEQLGMVERTPDPHDGRAKLIRFTDRGWEGISRAREAIAGLEADYAERVGAERYEQMCETLQALLDSLRADPGRHP
jgi:DNA-binding MarR family transcriptional regulator